VKYKIIILSLILLPIVLSSVVLNAQTDTIIDNKIIVKSYNNSYLYALMFKDYDNSDSLWFSFITDTSFNIYSIDNNLNINKSISNERKHFLYFKLNNKLYGTQIYNSLPSNYDLVIDSIYLYVNDINGNNIISRLIFTNNEDTNRIFNINECFVTNDFYIAILLNSLDTINNIGYEKLLIIDTLGNKKASKMLTNIPSDITSAKLYETNSNYVITVTKTIIGKLKYTKDYFLDKANLNIIDSCLYDSAFFIENHKKINDSIFITISNYGERLSTEPPRYFINIVNYKTRKIISKIKIEYGGAFIAGDYYLPNYQEVVDYINTDSIYYCCFVRNSSGLDGDFSGFFQIVNFGIDGHLNFDYRFTFDSFPKLVSGIKATSDGGVIMSVQMEYSYSWIMKFHPKGIIGLTNIETGEKETIKVYPNPAKDFVYVDIEATNFKKGEIELFDMQGKLVKKAKLSAKHRNRVDVSNLNGGAYTYNVSLNGKTISGKVIVGK
jgi:hypothetical protein